ncbi:MAG: nucleotidyltransferase substrate binding protein [Bacteroidota bacterium]|nr:nucleotidyltransferase substrate binding protein [Bacteroidota bacterium]
MQNGNRLQLLYSDLVIAILSFEKSLDIDLHKFTEFEGDIFRNGQIQKFEYTIELLWKTLKKFFETKREKFFLYPKDVIKGCFAEEIIDETNYLVLIDAIESRNLLSHVYKMEMFEIIYPQLNSYANAIRYTVTALEPYAIQN